MLQILLFDNMNKVQKIFSCNCFLYFIFYHTRLPHSSYNRKKAFKWEWRPCSLRLNIWLQLLVAPNRINQCLCMNEYIFHIHISSLQSNPIKYFYYITPRLPKNVAICFFIPIVIYFWAFIKKIEKFTLALFRFTECFICLHSQKFGRTVEPKLGIQHYFNIRQRKLFTGASQIGVFILWICILICLLFSIDKRSQNQLQLLVVFYIAPVFFKL